MKHIARRRPVPLATFALAGVLAFGAVLSQPYAQSSGSYSTGGSQQFALPGFSSVGNNQNSVTLFEANFNAGGGLDLGCGGIGLMDFMNSTFDLGNIVEQFKGSLNTMLSKALVTFAMSSPQIASLFDTLNAFGNARFDMFNQSCDINQIRAEVKQKYMEKCIADGNAPDSCTNMSAGGPQDVLKQISEKFAGLLRQSENINETIRGPLCSGNDGSYNPNNMGCGIMAFLPQFKLCLRSSIGETCPIDGYGTRDAPISVRSMSDAGTEAGARAISNINAVNLSSSMAATTDAIKQQAAAVTDLRLQNGDLPEGADANNAPAESETTQKLIDEFKSQLACTDQEDPFIPLKIYREELVKLGVTGLPEVNDKLDFVDIEDYLSKKIMGEAGNVNLNDAEGVKKLLRVGVVCLMNRDGVADPAQLIAISKAPPAHAMSYIRMQAEEIGHTLSIELATFIINRLQDNTATLAVDQMTKPIRAQAEEASNNGVADEDFQAEQDADTAGENALKEPIEKSVQAMIERLKLAKEEENRRYENYQERMAKRKELTHINAVANGYRMDFRAANRARSGRGN